jgi:hypothetical protein
MLDALRFAIHIRRGDVVTDGWTERILSTQYYIKLARAVTQVCCLAAGFRSDAVQLSVAHGCCCNVINLKETECESLAASSEGLISSSVAITTCTEAEIGCCYADACKGDS